MNALAGCALVFAGERAGEKGVFQSLDNETVRIVIGVLSFVTGILKILSPVAGNLPVLGDLVPALANLAGGFILGFEFFQTRRSLDFTAAERVGGMIEKYKRLAGFVCLGAAAVHLFFYPIIFL
ncbi:MAG: hypothetical protein LBG84_00225 [Treponema sp.]|nr:hypothetical protein [Treponema sp.]